jgi:hypothetical protein
VDGMHLLILSLGAALALLAPATGPAQTVRPTDIVAVDDFIDAARTVFGTLADGVGPAEAMDELIDPGVAIFVSRRSAAVRRVVLSEARASLPRGLTVGVAREEVERALGEPQMASDASMMYRYADGFPTPSSSTFARGGCSGSSGRSR